MSLQLGLEVIHPWRWIDYPGSGLDYVFEQLAEFLACC